MSYRLATSSTDAFVHQPRQSTSSEISSMARAVKSALERHDRPDHWQALSQRYASFGQPWVLGTLVAASIQCPQAPHRALDDAMIVGAKPDAR